jgi:starch synthase (maltosyl-transferring)
VRLSAGLDDAVVEAASTVEAGWDRSQSDTEALWVDRLRAGHSAWYELFPRSYGGFRGVMKELPRLAEMGFDVLYLPPIHPIGQTHRKGKNNTLDALPDDVGSPWAIGSAEGGHTAIHPALGTEADFAALVDAAAEHGMDVALDYALQCSPDHPWVAAHPEWFNQLPDGSIRYAENPPKKYQDIYPINFWPERDADRRALWSACRDIFEHWIARGIRIFRVDNPHTKPLAFWAWVIADVHNRHPDVLFLAEAFTDPPMMAKLAEVGFSQSYTYFTWRYSRQELTEYLTTLTSPPLVDTMRPNFWPNTPDILEGMLRDGSLAAFALRFVLAATLTPNYGLYSGYELGENRPASPQNTEYLDSEKYQIVTRDFTREPNLDDLIRRVNRSRRLHRALQVPEVRFHPADNDAIVAYSRRSPDGKDVMLVVVNLDPSVPQAATLDLDLAAMGLPWDEPLDAHDELIDTTFVWQGPHPWVRLDPAQQPAHLLHLRRRS